MTRRTPPKGKPAGKGRVRHQRTSMRPIPGKPGKPAETAAPDLERLQKVLATAGIASRRDCEELITTGRVEVDGQVVTELGTKVNPGTQTIRVDGSTIKLRQRVYFAVNKPAGVLSTNFDPSGRTRVVDLVPESLGRVFTIGRIDKESEGLIIVTNDGDLAHRLTHPVFGVPKSYEVIIAGVPDEVTLAKMKQGVHLSEGFVRPHSVKVLSKRPQSTMLEIILKEGKNREIRRMLAKVGHKVVKLKRTAIAELKLGSLPSGAYRRLSGTEIAALFESSVRRKRRIPAAKRKTTASPTAPKAASRTILI